LYFSFLFVENFLHEVKILARNMHLQLSDKGSMESLSDGLFFDFFIVYELDHVRVRAAGIGPAEREGFLFL